MKSKKITIHFYAIFINLLLLSCSATESKTNSEIETPKEDIVTKVISEAENEVQREDNETIARYDGEIEAYKINVKSMYDQLIIFKGKEEFHKSGFQHGNQYSEWLNKLDDLKNVPESNTLLKSGVVVGELQTMGFEYLRSKGNETEATRLFKKSFENFFNSQSIKTFENKEHDIDSQNLGALFGEWKITNTVANMNYIYKIYQSKGKYTGIMNEDFDKPEYLIKKGSKFSVRGNSYGEYYIINSKKEMTLFDQDGELKSAGYVSRLLN